MILLVGGLGSVGTRYKTILEYLGEEFDIYDYHTPNLLSSTSGETKIESIQYDKAILCTPTETHVEWVKKLETLGKPYLCEKPLSKSIEEAESVAHFKLGSMVCNYKLLFDFYCKTPHIYYNFFKTGKDGLLWDCAQLVYVDPYAIIRNDSPTFQLHLHEYDGNEDDCLGKIPFELVERSYISMIVKFLRGGTAELWTMEDGAEMTRVVQGRVDREKASSGCTGPLQFH